MPTSDPQSVWDRNTHWLRSLFLTTEGDRRQREEHSKMGSPQEEDYTTLDIVCTVSEEG